jgi:hypothetical protein
LGISGPARQGEREIGKIQIILGVLRSGSLSCRNLAEFIFITAASKIIHFAPECRAFLAHRRGSDHPVYRLTKSSRISKGNVYLKTALVEAANAAARAKATYLRDKFHRLKARRGYKRAVVAVAHKILVAIYHIPTKSPTTTSGISTWTSSTNTTSLGTWFIAWNV